MDRSKMKVTDVKVLTTILMFVMTFLLSACSSMSAPDAPKEASNFELTVVAADNVNPDEKKRASPIQVKIFELKEDAAFSDGDYFSLMNAEKATLAADLLAKEDFILRPGESKVIKRKGNPNTTAIGILAGYYDLPGSTWRQVIKLEPAPEAAWYRAVMPANKVKSKIELQSQGIVLTKEK